MYTEEVYEELTEREANFLLDLYEAVRILLYQDRDVTLIALSGIVKVSAKELVDYLPNIINMVDLAKAELA